MKQTNGIGDGGNGSIKQNSSIELCMCPKFMYTDGTVT